MTPLARPALFVTDLDETLLDHDRTIPGSNLEAMRRAAAAGVVLAVATGRRPAKAREVLALLDGLAVHVAASNGALLLAPDGALVERLGALDRGLVLEVAGAPEVDGAPLLAIPAPGPAGSDDDGRVWVLAGRPRRWFASSTPFRPETWEPADPAAARAAETIHIAFVLEERAAAERIGALLAPRVTGRASLHVVRHPARASGALLELVPPGGKGLALRGLVRRLGIPVARTGAIGDEANDCDLVDAAALPYAVAGSVLARLRPGARVVAGGVAEALEDFLLRVR